MIYNANISLHINDLLCLPVQHFTSWITTIYFIKTGDMKVWSKQKHDELKKPKHIRTSFKIWKVQPFTGLLV